MLSTFPSIKYELLNAPKSNKWKNPVIVILVLLLCYFVFYSMDNRVRPGIREQMTIFSSSDKKRYLSSDLAAPNRLGNHLFEFAALYGLSQKLNRIPAFWIEDKTYQRMLDYTREILPGLVDQFTVFQGKVPTGTNYTKFHEKCCTFDNPERLEEIPDEYLHLTGHFYQSWKYFPERRNEIISYLKPRKRFKILPKSDENTSVTCIHARRGDFKGVGFYAADENFIRKAVQFIQNQENRKKHTRQMTVLFGDDQQFMKDIFPETVTSDVWAADVKPTTVHFVSANSPPDDLLYSSQHCDNVLISAPVSTFGWWIGYLSKGNRVFYLDVTTIQDSLYKSGKFKPDDFYLPKWTALKMSADNSTVIETNN